MRIPGFVFGPERVFRVGPERVSKYWYLSIYLVSQYGKYWLKSDAEFRGEAPDCDVATTCPI